jgi:hypothetical protein
VAHRAAGDQPAREVMFCSHALPGAHAMLLERLLGRPAGS